MTPTSGSRAKRGSRITSPRTTYVAYFHERETAQRFAQELARHGHNSEQAERPTDGLWRVDATQDGYRDEAFVEEVKRRARKYGGTYDGDLDVSV
jgi:hypothetical protein